MPGSFLTEPQDHPRPAVPGPSSLFSDQESLNLAVEREFQTIFASKELGASKTAAQKHLIGQLDTLTYLIIGYQFLRYTHGSCMPPTLAHLLVQFLLYSRHFTAMGPGSGRQIFAEYLNSREQHFQAAGLSFDRQQIIDFIFLRMRNVILWKFLVCLVYHTLLVVLYLRPLANKDRLHFLQNGSWYFVSFVGEEISRHNLASSSWWLQLWQLGLFGLLGMDVVILIFQLILYQSIFLQSTISPKGLRLNEAECDILRAEGPGPGLGIDTTSDGVPDIFHIKLYESLGEDPLAEFDS
ncbi:hypothetical protein METBIDRAFT_47791 [Metschnikowia bicuspidata var. bicuspidata NRRL YB-4993]|uniref:Uncharacterized protein n=1 Tax=Metschnikowia bicuspidata var. bicuspidata NRRL YB-4993 TaxID=869754 RepID=A0A1A0H1V6_9ASCO|nr:hypothetical protein METBIDRAFT_47791 [Metschnikowia bicuspidata var. bicuspidata NRRL YB-4993]OBA18011.1 hypothetical protein METBIDRAFT_47791 [Metschnikowia bicuspidata var. bicuspidata NRRL YB-4993]